MVSFLCRPAKQLSLTLLKNRPFTPLSLRAAKLKELNPLRAIYQCGPFGVDSSGFITGRSMHNSSFPRPEQINSSTEVTKTELKPSQEPKEKATKSVTTCSKQHDDLDGIFYDVSHFRHGNNENGGDSASLSKTTADWRLPHPVWSLEERETQISPHHVPKGIVDALAYVTVKTLRVAFDLLTGYSLGFRNEKCYLRRVIFLETVAGVPGMVGAMIRHLSSLRRMERDYGWIHTLLEEAENERMHLMIAMSLRKPSVMIRLNVLIAQGFFLTWYVIMYLISTKYCHRFVGYLEEEAFKTYTALVEDLDSGELPKFDSIAPSSVQRYYRLGANGTLRDVFLAMRADENHHREVNHTFANLGRKAQNPFPPGY